jgi:DoxX
MRIRLTRRDLPGRLATGAFILHAGLDKWNGPIEQAEAVHGMAANAFPFLKSIPPDRFLRMLAASEVATGALLLSPFVSGAVAGTALTGFSGSLLAMYARTPAMRKPGSIWPTQAGTPVSKDVWMLGIGLGLLAGARARDVAAS